MRHNIEVDQSIKIEDAGPTVLAFANEIEHAVVISSRTKNEAFQFWLRRGESRDIAYLTIFAVGLFLLLEDHLDILNQVTIDTEYIGHEAQIRSLLLRQIWRKQPSFEADQIVFRRVGKKSPAHIKAERVRRKLDRGFRNVRTVEMLRLLK